jgi:hypothetical protein
MEKSGAFKYIRLQVTIPFLFYLLLAGNALGLPCKGETVNISETLKEVAAKCGEAALKDQRIVTVEETDEEGTHRSTSNIEEWSYDSGPEELVMTYRFENGKLVEISSNGYGSVRDFSVDRCQNGEALAVGDSTIETYLKCGDPLAKEKLGNKTIEAESGGIKRRTILSVAEWTYRYGPNAPGYTVTFENGLATKIRTREFGK